MTTFEEARPCLTFLQVELLSFTEALQLERRMRRHDEVQVVLESGGDGGQKGEMARARSDGILVRLGSGGDRPQLLQ